MRASRGAADRRLRFMRQFTAMEMETPSITTGASLRRGPDAHHFLTPDPRRSDVPGKSVGMATPCKMLAEIANARKLGGQNNTAPPNEHNTAAVMGPLMRPHTQHQPPPCIVACLPCPACVKCPTSTMKRPLHPKTPFDVQEIRNPIPIWRSSPQSGWNSHNTCHELPAGGCGIWRRANGQQPVAPSCGTASVFVSGKRWSAALSLHTSPGSNESRSTVCTSDSGSRLPSAHWSSRSGARRRPE